MGVSLDHIQRFRMTKTRQYHISDQMRSNSWSQRDCLKILQAFLPPDKHPIKCTMKCPGKHHNFVTSRHSTGQSKRGHHSLGTRIAKAGTLHTRQFTEQLGGLPYRIRLQTQTDTMLELLLHSF